MNRRGYITLCPTRWRVRGDTLAKFIDDYIELMDLWDWSLQATCDTEMKSKIQGVKAVIPIFHFSSAVPLVK